MALNFPDNPTVGQVYTDTTAGFSYEWDGVVWQSYTPSASSNIKILDDISGSFNGSTQTFALAVSGVSLTPANAQQLRVVLGGIVQEPATDYTVLGSNITFTSAPGSGLDCSIVSLGPAVSQIIIDDGSITPEKLSTGGPYWNTSGDLYIAGITTITNASGTVTAGIGTTALIVEGNARITGILTVGSSSVTINGSSNQINIGSGVTITSNHIIASGIVTATSFFGDVTGDIDGNVTGNLTGNVIGNLTGNVIGNLEGNINSTGISTFSTINVGVISATTFVGDGSGLTGAGSTVFDDTSTNATFYPILTQTTSGIITSSSVSTTKLTFNPSTGVLSSTQLNDAGGNVRSLTNNSKGTSYTLVASDVGELINITTGGVTVPSGVFSAGDNVTIYNNSSSSQTITEDSGVTLRLVGTASTGNRSLDQRGLATVLCVASNEFVISGGGLS